MFFFGDTLMIILWKKQEEYFYRLRTFPKSLVKIYEGNTTVYVLTFKNQDNLSLAKDHTSNLTLTAQYRKSAL